MSEYTDAFQKAMGNFYNEARKGAVNYENRPLSHTDWHVLGVALLYTENLSQEEAYKLTKRDNFKAIHDSAKHRYLYSLKEEYTYDYYALELFARVLGGAMELSKTK